MSRASRRFARSRTTGTTRELTIALDQEWTDQVDILGRKIVVAAANWQAVIDEAATTLGLTEEGAAMEVVGRYLETTACDGHPQGLMAWLAAQINEGAVEIPTGDE